MAAVPQAATPAVMTAGSLGRFAAGVSFDVIPATPRTPGGIA